MNSFAELLKASLRNDFNDKIWLSPIYIYIFFFSNCQGYLGCMQTSICTFPFFHRMFQIKFRLRCTLLIHPGIFENLSFGPLIESREWPIEIVLPFVQCRAMFWAFKDMPHTYSAPNLSIHMQPDRCVHCSDMATDCLVFPESSVGKDHIHLYLWMLSLRMFSWPDPLMVKPSQVALAIDLSFRLSK